jgi:hypothetical protein
VDSSSMLVIPGGIAILPVDSSSMLVIPGGIAVLPVDSSQGKLTMLRCENRNSTRKRNFKKQTNGCIHC